MNRPVPADVLEGIPFGWWQAGTVYPSPDKAHKGKDWLAVKRPCWFRESGVIVFSGLLGELGSYVQLQADSDSSRFWGLAHLSRRDVSVGQVVDAGEPVGITGGVPGEYGAGKSDGAHVHEECRVGWQWGDRIDPDSVVLEDTVDIARLTDVLNKLWDVKGRLESTKVYGRKQKDADARTILETVIAVKEENGL